MILGSRRAGLSISLTADDLGFSHTSLIYSEWCNGAKKKKSVSGSTAHRNALLLMRQVNGEWPDWFELIEKLQ